MKQKQKNITLPDHPFWRFSLQFYQQPKVEDLFLYLQNSYGLNVNVLLFFCWVAYNSQGGLTQHKIREILLTIRPWHEKVVLPLRRIRQYLKAKKAPWVSSVREHILQEEIQAEHAEQLLILQSFEHSKRRVKAPQHKAADICRSISAYCRVMRTDFDKEACDVVAQLMHILFEKLKFDELKKLSRKRLLRRRGRNSAVATQLWLDL